MFPHLPFFFFFGSKNKVVKMTKSQQLWVCKQLWQQQPDSLKCHMCKWKGPKLGRLQMWPQWLKSSFHTSLRRWPVNGQSYPYTYRQNWAWCAAQLLHSSVQHLGFLRQDIYYLTLVLPKQPSVDSFLRIWSNYLLVQQRMQPLIVCQTLRTQQM